MEIEIKLKNGEYGIVDTSKINKSHLKAIGEQADPVEFSAFQKQFFSKSKPISVADEKPRKKEKKKSLLERLPEFPAMAMFGQSAIPPEMTTAGLSEVGKSFINEAVKTATSPMFTGGGSGLNPMGGMIPTPGSQYTEDAVTQGREFLTGKTEAMLDKSQAAGAAHFIGALPVDLAKFAVAGPGAKVVVKPLAKFVGPTARRLIHGGVLGEQFGILSGKNPIESIEDAGAFAIFEGTAGLGSTALKAGKSIYKKTATPVFNKVADVARGTLEKYAEDAVESGNPNNVASVRGTIDFLTRDSDMARRTLHNETGAVISPENAVEGVKGTLDTAYNVGRRIIGDKTTQLGPFEDAMIAHREMRLMDIQVAKSVKNFNNRITKMMRGLSKSEKAEAARLTEAIQYDESGNRIMGARNRSVDIEAAYNDGIKELGREMRSRGFTTEQKKEMLGLYKAYLTGTSTPENIRNFFFRELGSTTPKLEQKLAQFDWRYTPEEAQKMWDRTPPPNLDGPGLRRWQEKTARIREAATTARTTYDQYKDLLGIETNIEAYMVHYLNDSMLQNSRRVLGRIKNDVGIRFGRNTAPLAKKEKFVFENQRKTYGKHEYSEDLEYNLIRYNKEAAYKLARDQNFAVIEETMWRPLVEGSPLLPGYTEYKIQYSKALGIGTKVQIPKPAQTHMTKLSDEPTFFDSESKNFYNSLDRTLQNIGSYWRANILALNFQTFLNNAAGGAIQLSLKYTHDIAKVFASLPFPMELSKNTMAMYANIWGLKEGTLDSLRATFEKTAAKFGIEIKTQVPSYHFGGRGAKFAGETLERETQFNRAAGLVLSPMGAIEDYFKRVILFSSVGPETRAIAQRIENGTASEVEKAMYGEALNLVDRYGLGYENNPEWVKKIRHVFPFFSYLYHGSKLLGSMTGVGPQQISTPTNMIEAPFTRRMVGTAEAIKIKHFLTKERFAGKVLADEELRFLRDFATKNTTERIANILALGGVLGGLGYFGSKMEGTGEERRLSSSSTPFQLNTKGRWKLPISGADQDAEYWIRWAKYFPHAAAASYGARSLYDLGRGDTLHAQENRGKMYETISDEMIGVGPAADIAFGIMGYGKKYDVGMDIEQRTGRGLSNFVLGTRVLEPAARTVEMYARPDKKMVDYYRPGMVSQLTQNIPGVSELTRGQAKTDPYTGEVKYRDALMFWVGREFVNVKEIKKSEKESFLSEQAKVPQNVAKLLRQTKKMENPANIDKFIERIKKRKFYTDSELEAIEDYANERKMELQNAR